jgi:predicted neuraminidase
MSSLAPPPVLHGDAAAARWLRRAFQGIPSIAVAPDGRLWAAWYGGARGEEADNLVGLSSSDDSGAHWMLRAVIDPPDDVRAFDPALWCDPHGRLWLFWAQSASPPGVICDGVAGVWSICCDDPGASDPTWSPPRRIADGIMMNRPIVTADGTWLLPVSLWKDLGGGRVPPHLRHACHANVVASDDAGRTFALRGGADVPQPDFDEHMLLERRDGGLWMLVRSLAGIGESRSTDGGHTWSPGTLTDIPAMNARFHLRRLRSGRVLLVANHADPAEFRTPWKTRRNLTAWLSDDDGATWPWSLILDPREATSYPDADQDADGRIWLVWDRERYRVGEILLGCIREADILAGICASPGSFTARSIDRSGGVR